MNVEIDVDYTEHPTCPWCGYEHKDHAAFIVSGDFECDDCGLRFGCDVEVEVTYSTEKL